MVVQPLLESNGFDRTRHDARGLELAQQLAHDRVVVDDFFGLGLAVLTFGGITAGWRISGRTGFELDQRERVAELAVAGAEKILRKEINASAHADMLAGLKQDL